MDKITTIGLDLAKHTFHVVGCDRHGKVLIRARLSVAWNAGQERGGGYDDRDRFHGASGRSRRAIRTSVLLRLAHPGRNVPCAVQHAPDIDFHLPLDMEDGEDADRPARFVDIEPVDGSLDGHVLQAGPDVVMALPPMGRREDALRSDPDLPDSRLGVIERALEALAEAEVASQEMVEYQPEIAFGLGRELKTKAHARGACQQTSVRAARPSRLR